MATKAQHWARQRNLAKFRLKGSLACISNLQQANFLSAREKAMLFAIEGPLESIIDDWGERNAESKKEFMKRKEGREVTWESKHR